MANIFYDSSLLTLRDSIAEYIKNISDNLDNIKDLDVGSKWVCTGNSDIIEELEYLLGLIPTIKSSLSSYVDFMTVVDNTYKKQSENIEDALIGFKKDT